MDAILNLLISLGVDTTLWFQLATFLITFVAVRQLIFVPYFQAFLGRQGQTHGFQEKAEQLFAQTRELEINYQQKARGLTAEIQSIYDKARGEALKEQERIHAEASEKARLTIERAREKIREEYNKAREELIKQAPEISTAITAQLISKGIK
jgi:F0F1-type ATP synthase membrane subunit b/b'